jgi:predicted acetyltransferase
MNKKDSIKRLILSVLSLMVAVPLLFAQNIVQVSGKVVDIQNEPMIGVSVLEKGTTNGTITDIDGNYQISVRQGATLVFSYIGYITQEKTVSANTLDVTMVKFMKCGLMAPMERAQMVRFRNTIGHASIMLLIACSQQQ